MNYGYLIRHGETPANVEHLTRGTVNNLNLTPKGVEQAKRNGKLLKGLDIRSLKSSDRKHIKQTANIIGNIIGVDNEPKATLRSLDIGNQTEVPTDSVDPENTKKIASMSDVPVGGAQSPKDWIDKLWPEVKQFLEDIQDGETPALVTHGRPLNIIRSAVEGNGEYLSKKVLEDYPTELHGSVYRVSWDGEKFGIEGPLRG